MPHLLILLFWRILALVHAHGLDEGSETKPDLLCAYASFVGFTLAVEEFIARDSTRDVRC